MTNQNAIIKPSITVNPQKVVYIPSIPDGLVIVRDTREQLGYTFNGLVPIVDKCLKFGDYSIQGMENQISVERKGLSDFYGSISKGRKRLNAEFERMMVAERRFLVIEASEERVLTPELSYTKMHPNSIYATIISFEIKYNIHVYYGSRRDCQIKIINLFVQFYKNKMEAK